MLNQTLKVSAGEALRSLQSLTKLNKFLTY